MKPLVLVLALVAAAPLAHADVPHELGYSGRLTRADGTPVTGEQTVSFAIFDAPTGGSALWSEQQTLAFTNGFYSTYLGRGGSLPPELFDGHDRYLELSVDNTPLVPRQKLSTMPYALRALAADNVEGGTVDAQSIAVNGTTVIDGQGHLAGPARYTAGGGIEIDQTARTISLPTTCDSHQVLKWDGAAWTCSDESGASYQAGSGLALSGNTFGLTTACAAGQILKWSGTDWACAADDDQTVVAGPGLAKSGNSLGLVTTCDAGQLLKYDGATWSCAPDADTTYRAGSGLALSGNTLSLAKGCEAGELLAFDGTNWVCAPDENTSYSAGSGLSLSGTTFSLATGCAAGQLLKFDGSAWKCAADDDAVVNAGTGLAKSGNTLSLVTSCDAGQLLKFDGASWACAADTDTTYKAGAGLTLSGNTFALPKTCAVGEVLAWDGSTWSCTAQATNVYQAGAGLVLAGNTFSLPKSCATGEVMKWDGTSWKCAADDDAVWVAGSGVDITGNTISLLKGCAANQVPKWSGTAWTCAADQTGTSSFAAGVGLELAGSTFQLKTTCAADQVLKWTGTDWACADQSGLTAGDGIKIASDAVSADFISGAHAGTATTVARSDHDHDDRYYTKAETDALTTTSEFRKYTAVLALKSGTYCPAGWNLTNLTDVMDTSNTAWTYITDGGLFMGGAYNNYTGEPLYARVNTGTGMTKLCWKEFDSRGHAMVSWLTFNVASPAASYCPSGYNFLPLSEGRAANNSNEAFWISNKAGFFFGGTDSWSWGNSPYQYGSQYRFYAGESNMACFRVYGVEDDPTTRFGVFPVVLGMGSQANCPDGYTWANYSDMSGSNDWTYLTINDNSTAMGGLNSWNQDGENYATEQWRGSYNSNYCFKFYPAKGRASATIRPLQYAACDSSELTIPVAAVSGNGSQGGNLQLSGYGLWMGYLYDWGWSENNSGLFRAAWGNPPQIQRFCLHMEEATFP